MPTSCCFLGIVFWAGNFPLGKLALDELGPTALTAGRALVAAPLLVLVARFTAPLAHPLARRDYVAFVVLGLTGLVGNTTLWSWGLKHTTALNAGILGAAWPIFVALTAALLLGDRLGTARPARARPDGRRGPRHRGVYLLFATTFGLEAAAVGLVLSSLRSPFTSSMNWAMSLNCR